MLTHNKKFKVLINYLRNDVSGTSVYYGKTLLDTLDWALIILFKGNVIVII